MNPSRIRSSFTAVLFLLGWVISAGCGREPEVAVTPVDSIGQALMTATLIDVIFTDSGRLEARVTGPLVKRFEGESPWLEFPEGFLAKMFDTTGRLESTIRADYGKRLEVTRIMTALGNVIVRNEIRNEQLNTDRLVWNELDHTIRTEAPVRITTPGKVLYGTGLESNETFTNYRILSPRGEMTMEKDSV